MKGVVLGPPDDGVVRVGHHLRSAHLVGVDREDAAVVDQGDRGRAHPHVVPSHVGGVDVGFRQQVGAAVEKVDLSAIAGFSHPLVRRVVAVLGGAL